MSDGDVGAVGAGISFTGLVIMLLLGVVEMFIEHSTEDMRLGMLFVGIAMFLCGGFILWVTEP